MTAPAPDPRLVTLLSEHVFAAGGSHDELRAHLAAVVEAHVQERIAEAKEPTAADVEAGVKAINWDHVLYHSNEFNPDDLVTAILRAAAHRPEGGNDERK